jgi:IS30 family transposase
MLGRKNIRKLSSELVLTEGADQSDPHFRDMITISLAQWEQKEPGHLEGDLVAHCGNTTAGVYVNTLPVTDIATGLVENRAIWGKTAEAVIEALRDIKASLPFPLKSLDFDNGSELLIEKRSISLPIPIES